MMSNTDYRPFTAATNKFAYAQVFTRATLPRHDELATDRGHHRLARVLHRDDRRSARRTASV